MSHEDDVEKMAEAIKENAPVIVCSIGCCYGCQDCYGMAIGCHQIPCRCALPCICDFSLEDSYVPGCERHNSQFDTRNEPDVGDEYEEPELFMDEECPVCHGLGPCAYDEQGRPLIHPCTSEDL